MGATVRRSSVAMPPRLVVSLAHEHLREAARARRGVARAQVLRAHAPAPDRRRAQGEAPATGADVDVHRTHVLPAELGVQALDGTRAVPATPGSTRTVPPPRDSEMPVE